MRTKIRWSLSGFALSLILAVGGSAGAVEPEDEGELIVNSEFRIMNAFGDDLHVLTVKIEDGQVTDMGTLEIKVEDLMP